MIYLDNAATTKIDQEVLDEMMPYLTNEFGNAGSTHSSGRAAKRAIDLARSRVAEFINANPEQIIFTSGGTEANNMALRCVESVLRNNGMTHIVYGATEHDSIIRTANSMFGFRGTAVYPDNNGEMSPEKVCDATTKFTGLVSVMCTNNETGLRSNIREIADALIRHKYEGFLHTDCVQSAGYVDLDVEEFQCDSLSLSGHKIHAPKGIGALYVKNKVYIESPIITGGLDQEFGLRGGTENVAAIVGFGKACELARKNLRATNMHIRSIKTAFINSLKQKLRESNLGDMLFFNCDTTDGSKIVNFGIHGIDGQTLVLTLDGRGVCVSAGSACRSRETSPSHVLLAHGLSEEEAMSSVRVSFSRMNTYNEVVDAASIIADCARRLANACYTQG